MIPHVEVIDEAEHVDFARHAGGLPEPLVDDDAPLRIDFSYLSVVIHAVEVLDAGRVRGGSARELFLEDQPDGHRVHAYGLPRQARHEHLGSVRLFDERTESVRDFEPPLVIDFGGVISPKHSWLLHFAP